MNTELLRVNWFSLLQKSKVDPQLKEAIFIDLINAYSSMEKIFQRVNLAYTKLYK